MKPLIAREMISAIRLSLMNGNGIIKEAALELWTEYQGVNKADNFTF
jgi:hypothetical protein